MNKSFDDDIIAMFETRDKKIQEKNEEIERRFQSYKVAKEKSLNEEIISLREKKIAKVAKREIIKKFTIITLCASIGTVALAGYSITSINHKLVDEELNKVDKAAGFSQNIEIEHIAKDYPNNQYVTSKYVSDIINYENSDKVNKNIYYDEMIGYIYYHSRNLLDDIFSSMKEYIENNECSEELKKAFNYNNFDEYLKAHNFSSELDFDQQIFKFLKENAEKESNEDSDIEKMANEHNFTLGSDEQEYGGRN